MPDETNPTERRRWNDERWMEVWPKRERFTDAVTPRLLEVCALEPGERVLDVGCGGGKTTLAAAAAVGPAGSATGADLSDTLTRLARGRARESGVANVSFQVVDAQHDAIAGAPFDVALSQFGVMFFDDPVTAFTNIARHLRPGGRLAFACWRTVEENPWHIAPAVAPFIAAPPLPAAGKAPTGPFALADATRTQQILRDAGFTAVRRTAVDIEIEATEDAVVDDDQLAFMGVVEADLPAVRRAVDERLARFRRGSGLSRFPLAFQIFEAKILDAPAGG